MRLQAVYDYAHMDMNAPAETAPIANILSWEQIEAFRVAYKGAEDTEQSMLKLTAKALAGPYPPAGVLGGAVSDQFYDPQRFSPREREEVILSVLAPKTAGSGLTLAVHQYWALMVGMSVVEIADLFLLVGYYDGISTYSTSIFTFQNVLRAMKDQIEHHPDKIAPKDVLGLLLSALTAPSTAARPAT